MKRIPWIWIAVFVFLSLPLAAQTDTEAPVILDVAQRTLAPNIVEVSFDAIDNVGVIYAQLFIDDLQVATIGPSVLVPLSARSNFVVDKSSLSTGIHSVKLVVADAAGNPASQSWSIRTPR